MNTQLKWMGFAIGVCFTLSSLAQTNNAPVKNESTIRGVLKQTGMRREALTEQLGVQKTTQGNIQDYEEKMKAFKDLYLERIRVFNAFLEESILNLKVAGEEYTLEEWIALYNTEASDPNVTESQKANTLPNYLRIIQRRIDLLTPSYQNEVLGLFEIFGAYPQNVRAGMIPGFFLYDTLWRERIMSDKVNPQESDMQAAFRQVVIPLLKEGCRSYKCLAYSASDFATFLDSLAKDVSQDFKVDLALDSLKHRRSLSIPSPKFSVSSAIQILRSTEFYPVEYLSPVFDPGPGNNKRW